MPDKYKNDISIEVLVGLFMFIILIALGIFTIVLSRQNFLQKKYPVEVLFDEVGGLREGDYVFLHGTQVGVVKSTHLENNRVVVQADLDVPVHFRDGYKVEVMAASMLGGKMVKIYEGPLGTRAIEPDEEILGEQPIDILEELGVAVQGIKVMTAEVSSGEGTLGKLIKDDEMYDYLKATLENLHTISERLVKGEGTIGKLLSPDDHLYKDIQVSAENLRTFTEKINAGEGTLGKLVSDDQVYQDIQVSAANIRQVTEKISNGNGTLGKLVENDEIYVEAKKLLEDLRAAIDDMRETSPVTTFSTVLFGAF